MKSLNLAVILILLIQSSAFCSDFDDEAVMKFILTSLSVSYDDSSNLADLIEKTYETDDIENGWHELKD